MNNDPVLSRLGFARKAGKLSAGFLASKEACQKDIARLVIVGSDISEKSEKEIRYFSKSLVPVKRVPYTLDEISRAIGIKAGIVSVNDEGFSGAILKALEPKTKAPEQI